MSPQRRAVTLMIAALLSAAAGSVSAQRAPDGQTTPIERSVLDPQDQYQAGVDALDAGKYAEAIRYFNGVLQVQRNHPRTLFRLGQAKEGLGDLKGAAEAYRRALRADPTLFLVTRNLALVEVKLGETDAARADLATLQKRAAACANPCIEAQYVNGAIKDVQAALNGPSPAGAGG